MEKKKDHTRRGKPGEKKLVPRHFGRVISLRSGLRERTVGGHRGGFTLIELLVVMGIVSVAAAVSLPVLGRVRRSMRTMLDVVHTRHTTFAEIQYAQDHSDKFADSIATIWAAGASDSYEPSILVNMSFKPREHRNQSEYLGEYLGKAEYVHCPESGRKPSWLEDAWAAGDEWRRGWFTMGTKCFWRRFKGISEDGHVVEGPKTVCERGAGKVLASCMMNYKRYGQARLISSAYFAGGEHDVPSNTSNYLWPEFWIGDVGEGELQGAIEGVGIQAGYVDGHAVSSKASDTMGVWVTADGPLLSMGMSRGKYFLPLGGLR